MLPLKKLAERVDVAKQGSDSDFFSNLLYSGEQITKLVGVTLISLLEVDPQDIKYSLIHKAVRANGIGEWADIIEQIINGPSSHLLSPKAAEIKKELSQKLSNPSWQFGALYALQLCHNEITENSPSIGTKIQLKNWFSHFARIRNKTKGHGALQVDKLSKISVNLEKSLKLITENFILFRLDHFILKQNLSGTYRITSISNKQSKMEEYLATTKNSELKDGVYLFLDEPFHIELLYSSIEAIDFFLPNGGFNGNTFEILSYITGNIEYIDCKPFLRPPGKLPSSETEGHGDLEIIGNTFSNIPSYAGIYINRVTLEQELERVLLMQDRHPVVTLLGRGGIGKTCLTINVLNKICLTMRYAAIVWFSARDIDLLDQGPKIVTPKVLDEKDIALEYSRLLGQKDLQSNDTKAFLESELTKSSFGPTLFVMDNFETVKNPLQVYQWLDTYIRDPNKVLITSRFREFKGDYHIEVTGMGRDEFDQLVEKTTAKLEISKLLTNEYLNELFKESDGHPYVVKIMLGEVAKEGKIGKVKRVLAGKDDILIALFERTYNQLSLISKRVFLTLTNWRTTLPQVAIESVLKREEEAPLDIEKAIEELHRFSFIELIKSNSDGSIFVSVPLTAYVFGKTKLSVSDLKAKIEVDTQLLYLFGPGNNIDTKYGLKPRVERFFKEIATKLRFSKYSLNETSPVLEFLCRRYAPGWVLLADLFEELNEFEKAKSALQNYLQLPLSANQKLSIWSRLANLCCNKNDFNGEFHALAEICDLDGVQFSDLNNAIQRIYDILRLGQPSTLHEAERIFLLKKVTNSAYKRVRTGEGTSSDYTRLARVSLYCKDKKTATQLTKMALEKDPINRHAINLAKTLKLKIKIID
ncbi:MAG: NB-ARC domain-containing protein [Imperialibacter sp.]|uniref:NB-ARC domain-containing protein n=1 Tax=Imperialibacter sp. TaxID=2038411 RepID=UPI003A88608C